MNSEKMSKGHIDAVKKSGLSEAEGILAAKIVNSIHDIFIKATDFASENGIPESRVKSAMGALFMKFNSSMVQEKRLSAIRDIKSFFE